MNDFPLACYIKPNTRLQTAVWTFLLGLLLALLGTSNVRAQDIDWASIQGKTVKLFYPGVASWEFVRSDDHGTGAIPVRTFKKACADCHVGKSGEMDINADKIISGTLKKSSSKEPFETEPLAGMPGFKDVQVKAAYDDQNIYLHLQWKGSGASVADPSLAKTDETDKVAVQINNTIKSFALFWYGFLIMTGIDSIAGWVSIAAIVVLEAVGGFFIYKIGYLLTQIILVQT